MQLGKVRTLRDLPWNYFDMSKPSLWQIQYVKQLMKQTRISEMTIKNTRVAYGEAITALLNLRRSQRIQNFKLLSELLTKKS